MKTLLSTLKKGDTFQHPDNVDINLTVSNIVTYPGHLLIEPDYLAVDGVGNPYNFNTDQYITLIERAKESDKLPDLKEPIVKSELTRFKEMLNGVEKFNTTIENDLVTIDTNGVSFYFKDGKLTNVFNYAAV